jgi:hypothetical protein
MNSSSSSLSQHVGSPTFTTSQIDVLQQHIRLFKLLTKRYTDSDIPKGPPSKHDVNGAVPTPSSTLNTGTNLIGVTQGYLVSNDNVFNSSTNSNFGTTNLSIPQPQSSIAKPTPFSHSSFNPSMSSNVDVTNISAIAQQAPMSFKGSRVPPTASQSTQLKPTSSSPLITPQAQPSGSSNSLVVATNINLSWQCFNTLLYCGPSRPTEGLTSIASEASLVFIHYFYS